METTIYVTFHRNLYNIYHQMPPNVQCIGVEVRPEFPKTIVTTIPVIKEHDLPGYIDLQKYRFNESSVIVNLRHHICCETKDEFFGFFQYDMIPSTSWLQKMQAAQTSKDVCVCGWLAPAAASLGHSEVLSVKNSVCEPIPEFAQPSKKGGKIVSSVTG